MPIAKAGACVVGVDIVFKMIEDARENAKNAGLSNASFEVADLEELFENQTWAKAPYDAVVMDPGRSGAKRATLFLAKEQKINLIIQIIRLKRLFLFHAILWQHQEMLLN